MGITWVTAFLDTTADLAPQTERHWEQVTGYRVGPRRGESDQFATLVPPEGNAFLRVQVVDAAGPGGLHLDLHTDDIRALADQVAALGGSAQPVETGLVRCTSPGGLVICVVGDECRAWLRPKPVDWAAGERSLVDQVTVDTPSSAYDVEVDFWEALTGWERRGGSMPQFQSLVRPPGQPLRFLLQRRDDDDGPTRAHLDLACDDVDAERVRHEDFGGRTTYVGSFWRTLTDPSGRAYCLTPRDPETGLVRR